jgi:hypothetical protein
MLVMPKASKPSPHHCTSIPGLHYHYPIDKTPGQVHLAADTSFLTTEEDQIRLFPLSVQC